MLRCTWTSDTDGQFVGKRTHLLVNHKQTQIVIVLGLWYDSFQRDPLKSFLNITTRPNLPDVIASEQLCLYIEFTTTSETSTNLSKFTTVEIGSSTDDT